MPSVSDIGVQSIGTCVCDIGVQSIGMRYGTITAK